MRLWVLPEASPATGLGHVMRCVALAEAARDQQVEVTFVGVVDEVALGLVTARGLPHVRDVAGAHRLARPGDGVVFDGYGFTPDDHDAFPDGVRRIAIEDRARARHDVQVVVNPNLPDTVDYDLPPGAQVLVGPEYALVRSEFTAHRRLRRATRRLVVTFGGSDVAGLGPLVADWAVQHGSFEVTLLVGPAAPTTGAPEGVTVVRAPPDVAAVLGEADAAVSAAGSTTWELCAMGVPTALVQVADNQDDVGAPVARRDAALFLGGPALDRATVTAALDRLADPAACARLSRSAMDLVDGRGPQRVVAAALPQLRDS